MISRQPLITLVFALAAMVLDLVARGQIDGKRLLHWSEADLMWVSPFTTRRLGQGALRGGGQVLAVGCLVGHGAFLVWSPLI